MTDGLALQANRVQVAVADLVGTADQILDVVLGVDVAAGECVGLGVRESVTYEGQAAIELEQLAGDVSATPYPWRFGAGVDLVAAVHDELAAGRPRAEIAAAFHETVAAAAAGACAEATSPQTVVLSGGTFQNLRLLDSTRSRLEAHGFTVLTHRRVPPNDGGISYGQAAIDAARLPAG